MVTRDRRTERMPRMDPEITEIVREAGRGINPLGFKNLPQPTAPYSPYLWFLLAAIVIASGGFVGWQLRSVLWAAILVAVPFVGCGVWAIVVTARRTPAWHRARRAVRAYVAATGAVFPRELRFFG